MHAIKNWSVANLRVANLTDGNIDTYASVNWSVIVAFDAPKVVLEVRLYLRDEDNQWDANQLKIELVWGWYIGMEITFRLHHGPIIFSGRF